MAVFFELGGTRMGPPGPPGDAGGVTSVHGRTGAVVGETGDYTAAQIDPDAPIADATTARTLAATDKVGVYFTGASAIAVTAPTLAAGTVIPLWQRGAGQITVTGSGVTLAIDGNGDYLAKSYAAESIVVLTWLTATVVHVTGSLEAAP